MPAVQMPAAQLPSPSPSEPPPVAKRRRTRQRKNELVRAPWLSPMIALRIAAVYIQSQVRGLLARFPRPKVVRRRVTDAKERLLDRYLVDVRSDRGGPEGGFSEWCAVRLQSWARCWRQMHLYELRRFSVYQIAALQIQAAVRDHGQSRYMQVPRKASKDLTPEAAAAAALQDVWRRFTNKKIFRYYRDLIRFRLVGDPASLLRTINPGEANFMDKATGLHVRFRLGGASFPPMMYYKIYLHRPLCDVGAFAPRDYTTSKPFPQTARHTKQESKAESKSRFGSSFTGKSATQASLRVGGTYFGAVVNDVGPDGTANWYRRVENNAWRPITNSALAEIYAPPDGLFGNEAAAQALVQRGRPFHYLFSVRAGDRVRMRKEKKRRWLAQLYRDGLAKEKDDQKAPLDWDGDSHVEDLLEWTQDLDYDEYLQNWASLATSAPSGR
ncbi:hypothetical protein M885DRAFT_526819 [Pelagophyceae sp. CCMP2097]|nr:hypothetical protein M885DRAFT_526819 [Pelagophyceae sp. CCMP2097]